MKNKILQTLGTIGFAIMIAATMGLLQQLQQQQQQQQLVYASIDPETGNNIDDEEEAEIEAEEEGGGESGCSTTRASDPELEGWLIETCGNGDVTWISPSGIESIQMWIMTNLIDLSISIYQ